MGRKMATEKEPVNVIKTDDCRFVLQTRNIIKKKDQKENEQGLTFMRRNTEKDTSPYDSVKWEFRTAEIKSDSGSALFRQENVEIPKGWSNTALNIVASKYFHGGMDSPNREKSVKQLVGRVANTIADWGQTDGYFRSNKDAAIFRDELVPAC